MTRAFRKPSDFPSEIPIFPLPGAVLFPGSELPLNIFEPRYLNMVDDALSGARLIGMIQPGQGGPEGSGLCAVGCAGRISSFQETDDGRYLIVLSGLSRFSPVRETTGARPYRAVEAAFGPFARDLRPEPASAIDREGLLGALETYVERQGASADWQLIREAPDQQLVHALASGCPFTPPEKQALLEAGTLAERCGALISLLLMNSESGGQGLLQ